MKQDEFNVGRNRDYFTLFYCRCKYAHTYDYTYVQYIYMEGRMKEGTFPCRETLENPLSLIYMYNWQVQ